MYSDGVNRGRREKEERECGSVEREPEKARTNELAEFRKRQSASAYQTFCWTFSGPGTTDNAISGTVFRIGTIASNYSVIDSCEGNGFGA